MADVFFPDRRAALKIQNLASGINRCNFTFMLFADFRKPSVTIPGATTLCCTRCKIEHILTSCAQKRLRRKLTAALMVGMYTRNPFGDVAVNHDNRTVNFRQADRRRDIRTADNAVHDISLQHFHKFLDAVRIVPNLAEHALVAIGVQIILDMFHQRCHKRM